MTYAILALQKKLNQNEHSPCLKYVRHVINVTQCRLATIFRFTLHHNTVLRKLCNFIGCTPI